MNENNSIQDVERIFKLLGILWQKLKPLRNNAQSRLKLRNIFERQPNFMELKYER